jgi:hypothetical protein
MTWHRHGIAASGFAAGLACWFAEFEVAADFDSTDGAPGSKAPDTLKPV